jgi:hypothetical protein
MDDILEVADAAIRLILGAELIALPFLELPLIDESAALALLSMMVGAALVASALLKLIRH